MRRRRAEARGGAAQPGHRGVPVPEGWGLGVPVRRAGAARRGGGQRDGGRILPADGDDDLALPWWVRAREGSGGRPAGARRRRPSGC